MSALPRALDPCSGSRMMWFDRNHPDALFGDQRRVHLTAPGGHRIHAGNVVPLPQRGAKPTTGKPS